MQLTEDSFLLYAYNNYVNHRCLSEDEFHKDLRQISTIRRMMSKFLDSSDVNIRLLINNFVIFYNCFEHKSASTMLEYKIDVSQTEYFNSVLDFLSLPRLNPKDEFNEKFYEMIKTEFSQ